MQSSRYMSRLFCNQACRKYSSNSRMPTLNDLPQPKGDWQTNYDALNRRYTLHLLLGIGVLAGTIVFGKAAGFLNMYNDYPEKPAVIDNYKVNK
ncbi:hypothetical protein WA026_023369 [Henosepilachna vigintioctopunctata]|uniref:Deltamethrin resistance protein prag01 domain-containing protein n=1 Tax=Henosepilachna vigintioctopunctata TaxID=420089 RepID=A0AAW1V2H5_9CUCU